MRFLVALLSCLLLMPQLAVRAATLDGVRMGLHEGTTRVVFDLSAPRDFRIARLGNPERLVVDLLDARPRGPLGLPEQPGSVVAGLRSGVHEGRNLRVVLDLKAPVEVASQVLRADAGRGPRLLLVLRPDAPGGAEAPSAGEGVSPAERRAALQSFSAGREAVVAIDAGHGGKDPGAIGPTGVREKDVVLAIARRLKALVDATPGMRAVLTRNADSYLPLRERMSRARQHRADLFLSIHADAFRDRRVTGSSVYVLSENGASSEAARWLAEQENSADLIGGVALGERDRLLQSVLLDLSQTGTIQASTEAATQVLAALRRVGEVKREGVQYAGFAVLKSPDVPSVLVETAFISNPAEEKRLADPRHQQKLAAAILGGIEAYFRANPPAGTLLALERPRPSEARR